MNIVRYKMNILIRSHVWSVELLMTLNDLTWKSFQLLQTISKPNISLNWVYISDFLIGCKMCWNSSMSIIASLRRALKTAETVELSFGKKTTLGLPYY